MNYQKIYNDLISHRKLNLLKKSKELYTESHHVVPRCLGGNNHKSNLVRLTAREHFIAHRLLTKINVNNSDLALSVLLMMKVQGGKVSSREIARLRELAAEATSERSKKLWEDSEFRDKMSANMTNLWKDPQFVEMILISRSGVWTKERRILASERTKKQFEDETQRKIQSSIKVDQWKDELTKGNILEGQRKFLEDNPWPWQRPRAIPSKHIWALAATYWELSKFNPHNRDKQYGYVTFTKEFCSGKYGSIFSYMTKMFEGGWIPMSCSEWLSEYGDRM